MTRFFLDTEFYEDGTTIDLIALSLVREDGHFLYVCNQEARLDRVSPWVRENVLPQLPGYGSGLWYTRAEIRDMTSSFLTREFTSEIEIWGYYADYDWVVFCQLFGTMMDLPQGFPKFCRDLKQLSMDRGNPRHPPRVAEDEHNALADARWHVALYDFLMKQPAPDKGTTGGGLGAVTWPASLTSGFHHVWGNAKEGIYDKKAWQLLETEVGNELARGQLATFWKGIAERLVCGCFSLDCREHGAYDPAEVERAERELPAVFARRHR